jgi:hypothetical protein
VTVPADVADVVVADAGEHVDGDHVAVAGLLHEKGVGAVDAAEEAVEEEVAVPVRGHPLEVLEGHRVVAGLDPSAGVGGGRRRRHRGKRGRRGAQEDGKPGPHLMSTFTEE